MNEISARQKACTDTFLLDGIDHLTSVMGTIGDDAEPDLHGEGGEVAELEREIADLLGKPAAVFLPSGTGTWPRRRSCGSGREHRPLRCRVT
uniref:threonine aldolase family protein n=1 Tax=Paractinoplanes polyasparticus TaxID=2856853 RepID=UPI001C851ED4|nr:threonine aldolase family protein [Actinoplanes polyasparticus]